MVTTVQKGTEIQHGTCQCSNKLVGGHHGSGLEVSDSAVSVSQGKSPARSPSEYSPVVWLAPWVSLSLGSRGQGPTRGAHYPPQAALTRLWRRQILSRLWVKQISCHSADTFSSPRNRNLRIPRADLIMPNTGSTICFRAAYRALPVAVRSFACIFSFTLASPEGVAASASSASSWCF